MQDLSLPYFVGTNLRPMREWESLFETHYPDPRVRDIYARWKRNRELFEKTDGYGMDGRDTELALRAATDVALDRLNQAEEDWVADGSQRGWRKRRWEKRRLIFFKALATENNEYEGTILFHGLDPDRTDLLETYLEAVADFDADADTATRG